MFDIWDEQNQLIKETYKKDNYSVELINEGEARVIVYFSSLGIYTPDARESFIENIIKQDRYEWSKIKADKVKNQYLLEIYISNGMWKDPPALRRRLRRPLYFWTRVA